MEEIFSDVVELFGAEPWEDDEYVYYGELKLGVVPKEGKAITVMANALFSPSFLLAESIETGEIDVVDRTIIELGAGSALPSLLAATLPKGRRPSLVVVTEYPDRSVMNTLRGNVERARALATERGKREVDFCRIECAEYEWGSDVSHLLRFLSNNAGTAAFDTVIMSDLLHFDSSHTALLESLLALLSKSRQSRVYVAAGRYTKQHVCDNFVDQARRAGIILVEQVHNQLDWQGQMVVRGPGLDREGLKRRRDMSRLWVGQWVDIVSE